MIATIGQIWQASLDFVIGFRLAVFWLAIVLICVALKPHPRVGRAKLRLHKIDNRLGTQETRGKSQFLKGGLSVRGKD